MENFKISLPVVLFTLIFITSCDESLDPIPVDERTENEKLLANDWQFQYILMDGVTIRHFDREGSPTLDAERDTDIRRNFLRYRPDYSYELFSNGGFENMGYGKNYQPNFGLWELEEEGDSLVLHHNRLFPYSKRYVIDVLTPDLFVRTLIGTRRTYLVYEINPLDFDVIEVNEWIEVFRPRTE